jgi:hypothetical protein
MKKVLLLLVAIFAINIVDAQWVTQGDQFEESYERLISEGVRIGKENTKTFMLVKAEHFENDESFNIQFFFNDIIKRNDHDIKTDVTVHYSEWTLGEKQNRETILKVFFNEKDMRIIFSNPKDVYPNNYSVFHRLLKYNDVFISFTHHGNQYIIELDKL